MATRYIEAAADGPAQVLQTPNLPNVAGICYRTDIQQVEIRDPLTGVARRMPLANISIQTKRTRVTLAQANAGFTLLAAIAARKYRLVSGRVIAIGGAAAALTTLDIIGTQTTAVKLVAFAQASLVQSAELKSGGAGAAILADGASYVANDANTAITVGVTGTAATTATAFDVFVDYVIEE